MNGLIAAVLFRQGSGIRDGRIELLVQQERPDLEHVALRLLVWLQIRHLRERVGGSMDA